MKTHHLALLSAVAALTCAASAQVTLTPLSTFGTNGWIAPGASPYVTIGNTERGLSVNPTTGNLLLVSRQNVAGVSNNVRVLNGVTGADQGGFDATGIAGGTFPVNMVDVDANGAIYVCNLSITLTTNFKVYMWPSEAAGPTTPPITIFDGLSGVTRTGDAFAVHGGVTSAAVFAAAGSNAVSASNFATGLLDGSNAATAYLSVGGTLAGSNDYRLGLTFVDADTVIGNQGANGRLTDFDSTTATATLAATINVGGVARRALDYTVIGGRALLALVDTNSSNVTVLDITDPLNPVQMAQANATVAPLTANGNGTGAVAWGPVTGNSALLYAMSSNQGIQAFTFTMGPSAAVANNGAGCDGLVFGANGVPSLGNATFEFAVANLSLVSPVGLVAFGSASIPGGIDLTGLGMPGCFSYTSFDLNLYTGGPTIAGVSLFPLPIPNNPALAGGSLSAQGVGFTLSNAFGLATSNGLDLTFGF
ncbi:MAG: DUF4623 domain-containing protein [Planctomycetes bacterium]|nr:DUF4623 domain-containing protein [Planctomycetota bacterium]